MQVLLDNSNRYLYIDEIDFIYRLREQCILSGLDYFQVIKPSGKDIMVTCPFHKEGKERKPSFGISTQNGVSHCLACGWSGTLSKLVSNIFGYDDHGQYGDRWLLHNFNSITLVHRPEIKIGLRNTSVSKERKGFTEEELDKYRYYHPYMYKRGLTDEIIREFDIGYDSSSDCITFPVYNLDRSPCFIARRSVRGKYFHYPSGVQKPVYCAERFVDGKYSYAVVVESFFNCLTLFKYGIPSVALLGTGDSYQFSILKQLPVRKYILALDPDAAGNRGRDKLRKALSNCKIITEYIIPPGKDINDLDSRVLELQEVF